MKICVSAYRSAWTKLWRKWYREFYRRTTNTHSRQCTSRRNHRSTTVQSRRRIMGVQMLKKFPTSTIARQCVLRWNQPTASSVLVAPFTVPHFVVSRDRSSWVSAARTWAISCDRRHLQRPSPYVATSTTERRRSYLELSSRCAQRRASPATDWLISTRAAKDPSLLFGYVISVRFGSVSSQMSEIWVRSAFSSHVYCVNFSLIRARRFELYWLLNRRSQIFKNLYSATSNPPARIKRFPDTRHKPCP